MSLNLHRRSTRASTHNHRNTIISTAINDKSSASSSSSVSANTTVICKCYSTYHLLLAIFVAFIVAVLIALTHTYHILSHFYEITTINVWVNYIENFWVGSDGCWLSISIILLQYSYCLCWTLILVIWVIWFVIPNKQEEGFTLIL